MRVSSRAMRVAAIALMAVVGLSACSSGGTTTSAGDKSDKKSSTSTTARKGADTNERSGNSQSSEDSKNNDDNAGAAGDSSGEVNSPTTSTTAVAGTSDDSKKDDAPLGEAISGDPNRKTTPVSATLESDCVRPGGKQTITIKSTKGAVVIYHATYSDGKDARDPDYYGGNNGGTAENGTWEDTWVVAAAAPAGRVKVDMIARGSEDENVGSAVVYFEVSDAAGSCD